MPVVQGVIRLACRNGVTSVPALEVVGSLALHLSVDAQGGYSITHTPTGLRVFRSQVTLPIARGRLSKISGYDWRFTDPRDMPKSTRDAMRAGWPEMGVMTEEDYSAWRRVWKGK